MTTGTDVVIAVVLLAGEGELNNVLGTIPLGNGSEALVCGKPLVVGLLKIEVLVGFKLLPTTVLLPNNELLLVFVVIDGDSTDVEVAAIEAISFTLLSVVEVDVNGFAHGFNPNDLVVLRPVVPVAIFEPKTAIFGCVLDVAIPPNPPVVVALVPRAANEVEELDPKMLFVGPTVGVQVVVVLNENGFCSIPIVLLIPVLRFECSEFITTSKLLSLNSSNVVVSSPDRTGSSFS